MEVSAVSTDAAVWTEVTISDPTLVTEVCPALADVSPCNAGDVVTRTSETQSYSAASYILWRIHDESPNSLELIGFSCDKSTPGSGLRLVFDSTLCPFAKVSPTANDQRVCEVSVLAVTGVLYSVILRLEGSSKSRFSLQHQSTTVRDICGDLTKLQKVTATTATADLFIVGGQSGSVLCVPVGSKAGSPAHLPFELRDGDHGLSRLWGLGFRGKSASQVVGLAAQSISGASRLFAIYEDKSLKVWDLVQRSRQFFQTMAPLGELPNTSLKSVWVEDSTVTKKGIDVALLYREGPPSKTRRTTVVVCTIHATQAVGDVRLSHLTLRQTFSVGQGEVMNCKLVDDKLWILQTASKGQCELLSADLDEGNVQICGLRELTVGEQLFQNTGQSWDDLLFALHHVGRDCSIVDEDAVSCLFLRRLLQPGVRQPATLKDALRVRGRYLSDFEASSLTVDGLRKEIKACIKSEPCDSRARLEGWMNFCSSYFQSSNQYSTPYGLYADPFTAAVGLVRRNSVSVIRAATHPELLMSGSVEDSHLPQNWQEAPGDAAVLSNLLTCAELISGHLGQMALGIFHEALLRSPNASLSAMVDSLLRVLDVGFDPLGSAKEMLFFGVDEIRAKMKYHHQRQRKFAMRIFQCVQELRDSAANWDHVFDVASKYINYLSLPFYAALPVSNVGNVPLGSVSTIILAQATQQISWAHYEVACNLMLLLSYLLRVQGYVGLSQGDATRIRLSLLPRVCENLSVNLLLNWLSVTFAEVPPAADCTLQLSSLQIDGPRGEIAQPEMLGAGEVALAEILAATYLGTRQVQEKIHKPSFPTPDLLHNYARRFVGWLLSGENADPVKIPFTGRATALSSILLQHGQYGNLEIFVKAVEQFSGRQKLSDETGSRDVEWSARLHLLGICSLARAQSVIGEIAKDTHVGHAIQCFFKAALAEGDANKVLRAVFFVPQKQSQGRGPIAAWRLQYFEWVMQLFDQHNLSEGAAEFAHAALREVDEAVGTSGKYPRKDADLSVKGRLWANIFKFSLDLKLYGNAYCAILSNPEKASKDTCLRRFIIVLCDRKASQVLCGNELTYGAVLGKVDEELATRAHQSDVAAKASLFKQLYALHMHHHNVQRAAGYMYEYAMSVRDQGLPNSRPQARALLQEEVDAFAAAINAFQLLAPSEEPDGRSLEWLSSVKRRKISAGASNGYPAIHANSVHASELKAIDVDQLVKEHALTLARVQLLDADVNISSLKSNVSPSDVVVLLLQHGLHEMAFSLVFLCWKDSSQKRELETVFEIMARSCCLLQVQMGSSDSHKYSEDHQLALTLVPDSPSNDLEQNRLLSMDSRRYSKFQASNAAKNAWQALKEYLEKYWTSHPNVRTVVADTILSVDKRMELPLWLINSFKSGMDSGRNNSGSRSPDLAALLCVYVNHERYVEAAYLLLEYLQVTTRPRPADIIKRRQSCGVWFPYTLVDRLLQQLSGSGGSNERMSQFEDLRHSLQNALMHHLDLVRKESSDVRVIAEAGKDRGQ